MAGLLYCERKAYYDRAYGKKTTSQAGKRAKEGEIAHLRFAEEGAKRQDKRCFIGVSQGNPRLQSREELRLHEAHHVEYTFNHMVDIVKTGIVSTKRLTM